MGCAECLDVMLLLCEMGWRFDSWYCALLCCGILCCYFGFVFAGLVVMIWLLFVLAVVCLVGCGCVSSFRLHADTLPLVIVNSVVRYWFG